MASALPPVHNPTHIINFPSKTETIAPISSPIKVGNPINEEEDQKENNV
jgi:hypothetical protein